LADRLIWVESQTDQARLWGYVGHPSESRSTRKGQFLFLNGRWIQDRSLQHALGEAYRGLLMTGRYPVAFLFLELSPDQVDVNIHPTKAEVRFRDAQSLYRQLLSTLRTRFLTADLDSTVSVPAGLQLAAQRPAVDPNQQLGLQLELAAWAKDRLAQWTPPTVFPGDVRFPGDSSLAPSGQEVGNGDFGSIAAETFRADSQLQSAASGFGFPDHGEFNPGGFSPGPAASSPSGDQAAAQGAGSPARQIMQVHDCYLVVETDEGITVIDQHALHERVMYEHLRRRVIEGAVESQKTLVPQPLEFGPREAAALLENKDLLSQLGYGVEEFGGTTVLLAAYPAMLANADHGRILSDIADQLAAAGQKPSRRDILDSLLHLMACKAAVKAGQRLKPEEMESLLAQRHLIDDAHHCPHGRPTALVLTRSELDRQFGRLG
jgi:DNA mismatch repair protein MutL